MNDITLKEGALSFEFKDVEFAEKYDDWVHYRNQFNSVCGSSKAVDFIVSQGDTVWLIEVKNYRHHVRTKPIEIADEIMHKVRDTMAGLVSAQFLASTVNEKKCASDAIKQTQLRVVLHLEQPRKPSRLYPTSFDPANVQIKLRQKLKFADPHPMVKDMNTFPTALGRVTSLQIK